ncbi:hypothetical protein HY469_03885 [Candidatus Roizmanbacteria bacterium]|nr:hypothetical protein [Candidatus Roizmanbacteria bacterium]
MQIHNNQYRIQDEARTALTQAGNVLIGLARASDRIMLPNPGPETINLSAEIFRAITTRTPLSMYTPVCPDWSRDSQGRYDFKSLGTGASFIAQKFLTESREVLALLKENGIPYSGLLVFADWGTETELSAKDTYGETLDTDQVVSQFEESFRATHALLSQHQAESDLFSSYNIISMTEFLAQRLPDCSQTSQENYERFSSHADAMKLADFYHHESFPINQRRLGITDEEENYRAGVQTLAEYATFSQAIDSGIIIAAESRIASRAYNILRGKHDKLPVIFLKGGQSLTEGVNIL